MQRRGQIHAALIHLVATCRIHFSNALSREVVQHEMTIYEDLTFTSVCGENVMDYSGENPGHRNSTEPGLYATKNLSVKWSKEALISSSSDDDKFIPDFEGRIQGELKSKRLVNKAEISAHWDPRSSPVSRMIPTAGDF